MLGLPAFAPETLCSTQRAKNKERENQYTTECKDDRDSVFWCISPQHWFFSGFVCHGNQTSKSLVTKYPFCVSVYDFDWLIHDCQVWETRSHGKTLLNVTIQFSVFGKGLRQTGTFSAGNCCVYCCHLTWLHSGLGQMSDVELHQFTNSAQIDTPNEHLHFLIFFWLLLLLSRTSGLSASRNASAPEPLPSFLNTTLSQQSKQHVIIFCEF